MTFHVGVDPYSGKVSLYNENEKNSTMLDINPVDQNSIEKVDEMFEEIKKKIGEKLGYICFTLNKNYGKKIRKKIIESGMNTGFKDVEIIDEFISFYISTISQTTYELNNNIIIWILLANICYVWQRKDKKAKYIGYSRAGFSKAEDIHNVIKESGLKAGPDIFFYSESAGISLTLAKQKFPSCKFFAYRYDYCGRNNGSLIKARIAADDKDIISFNVYPISKQSFTLKVSKNEIMCFKEYQHLPIKCFAKIKKTSNDNVLEIDTGFEKEIIPLPNYKTLGIKFEVDANGIYTVNFTKAVISLTQNNLLIIYDDGTQEMESFPAAMDYGFDEPKIGVNYQSSTVINNVTKYFNVLPKESPIPMKEYCSSSGAHIYYVLKLGQNKKMIETSKVVTDLVKESIKRYQISKDNVVVTLPSNFSGSQKEAYFKAVEAAGLINISAVDEILALEYGIENQYNLEENTEYLLIHFCDPKVTIIHCKVGDSDKENSQQLSIAYENFQHSKLSFFHDILAGSKNEQTKNGSDFENCIESFLDSVFALMQTTTNLDTIFVAGDRFHFAIISDLYPEKNVIFIEHFEELIVKGTVWA
jgi:hypothetical protein